jgi:hypothetical protein
MLSATCDGASKNLLHSAYFFAFSPSSTRRRMFARPEGERRGKSLFFAGRFSRRCWCGGFGGRCCSTPEL